MTPAELKAKRESLGLSRSQASALSGVPVRTWERIEQERSQHSALLAPLWRLLAYVERYGPLPD
jgi:transcriptional regulator with XRE-family HTH domain